MYDVIIVGGGSGGYAAAIRASQLGGKVALIEVDEIGGTCVNRGCIPTKVWLHVAYLLHWIRLADEYGIKACIRELDLRTIVERKNGVLSDIRMGMEGILKNNGLELIRGLAVLKSPREVDVDGTMFEAKKMILATGSCLDIPEIPGLEEAALTTDQVSRGSSATARAEKTKRTHRPTDNSPATLLALDALSALVPNCIPFISPRSLRRIRSRRSP